ncbi:MAG: hypothetical protein GC136_10080 [Alphaproteobacteria bacterium]|nr:hypothetical protein [Alphaproteobacteria bacterium]
MSTQPSMTEIMRRQGADTESVSLMALLEINRSGLDMNSLEGLKLRAELSKNETAKNTKLALNTAQGLLPPELRRILAEYPGLVSVDLKETSPIDNVEHVITLIETYNQRIESLKNPSSAEPTISNDFAKETASINPDEPLSLERLEERRDQALQTLRERIEAAEEFQSKIWKSQVDITVMIDEAQFCKDEDRDGLSRRDTSHTLKIRVDMSSLPANISVMERLGLRNAAQTTTDRILPVETNIHTAARVYDEQVDKKTAFLVAVGNLIGKESDVVSLKTLTAALAEKLPASLLNSASVAAAREQHRTEKALRVAQLDCKAH